MDGWIVLVKLLMFTGILFLKFTVSFKIFAKGGSGQGVICPELGNIKLIVGDF